MNYLLDVIKTFENAERLYPAENNSYDKNFYINPSLYYYLKNDLLFLINTKDSKDVSKVH
jgi:hypothetical protein